MDCGARNQSPRSTIPPGAITGPEKNISALKALALEINPEIEILGKSAGRPDDSNLAKSSPAHNYGQVPVAGFARIESFAPFPGSGPANPYAEPEQRRLLRLRSYSVAYSWGRPAESDLKISLLNFNQSSGADQERAFVNSWGRSVRGIRSYWKRSVYGRSHVIGDEAVSLP